MRMTCLDLTKEKTGNHEKHEGKKYEETRHMLDIMPRHMTRLNLSDHCTKIKEGA